MSDIAETHAMTFEKLVHARIDLDKSILERLRLQQRVDALEAEVTALRKMVCHVATGGRGAVL